MATTTEAETGGAAPATADGHSTEAHEGAHGGSAFPPLDAKTFPSQLFWLVVFFALLYALMSKLVLPRIAAILEARRNRIEGDLARAAALRQETEAALASYQKALADARSNATDIAAKTRETVNGDIAAKQAALDADLATKATAAEATIAKAKAKAMTQVQSIATDTALDIVASLTGTKTTKTAIARALKG